jgi:hypothetical protein
MSENFPILPGKICPVALGRHVEYLCLGDGNGQLHRTTLLNDVLLQAPVQLVPDSLYLKDTYVFCCNYSRFFFVY